VFALSKWGRRGWATAIVLLVLAILPIVVEITGAAFYLDIATRLVILAIAAVSLNLILGHGGMVSFGHAVYLGIGSYAVGIPVYYEIYNGVLHFAIAIGASALFAFFIGLICLRTKGVNFIMITMAFSQMVFFGFVSIEEYGGDDGLVIEYRSEFGGLFDIENATNLYYLCFVSLVVVLYLVHRIVNSRFGMAIQGTKGNERRMQSLGFHTYRYQLAAFVIAGAICGYAGALLGNFTNFISPEMMDWTRSGELIFMVVFGGAGALIGPVMGTASFMILEEYLSPVMNMFGRLISHVIDADLSGIGLYWQFVFGIILVLVVLFAKDGISGYLTSKKESGND